MKKILKIITAIGIIAIQGLVLIPAHSAFAIDNPDTIELVANKTKVFQNMFESGDILFVSLYNVAYSNNNTPSESALDAYVYSLYDTNGTTLLQSRSFVSITYGYGLDAIYFSAADAASSGITWESAYYITISGNPALFPSLEEDVNLQTYQLSTGDWITGSFDATMGRADIVNQNLIKTFFTSIMTTMQTQNNLTYLTLTGTAGYVLNALGRNTVLLAVPYFDYVVPDLFQTTIITVGNVAETHTQALQTELTVEQKLGTQIKDAFDGIGTMLGVSGGMVAAMWAVGIVFLIASIVFLYTGNTTGSLILALPMLFAGVYVGAIPAGVLFLGLAVVVIYAGYFLILRGL